LQRLGLILHTTPNHNIIIKTETTPKLNQTVLDQNLQPIGKIIDIIGPTTHPYATVKPTTPNPQKLTNTTAYTIPSNRRKEKNPHAQ
jgi:rRNA processing protein Gar1